MAPVGLSAEAHSFVVEQCHQPHPHNAFRRPISTSTTLHFRVVLILKTHSELAQKRNSTFPELLRRYSRTMSSSQDAVILMRSKQRQRLYFGEFVAKEEFSASQVQSNNSRCKFSQLTTAKRGDLKLIANTRDPRLHRRQHVSREDRTNCALNHELLCNTDIDVEATVSPCHWWSFWRVAT